MPDPPSLRSIWRALAASVEADWRAKIATAAYTQATRSGPLRLVLYDVTTLYFEAEYEDKLRKVGMSKERRVDPQIQSRAPRRRRRVPAGGPRVRGQQG